MPQPNDTHINSLSPETNQALQQVLDEHLGETFPAVALAVYHQSNVICESAWGYLDPSTETPLTCDALFDLASVTKLFTTTAMLSLLSEGKATLQTPLVEIVPEFGRVSPRGIDGGQDPHSKVHLPTPPELADVQVDPAKVTLFHLLTHTSGLPPWRDVFNAAGPAPTPAEKADPVDRKTRWHRGLVAMCQYNFVGEPDGVVRYSDIGLMLLGEAATRLHGTPGQLEPVIQQRVLDKLGLTDVMFNPVRSGRVERIRTVPTENDPSWRRRRAWGEVHDENACGLGGIAGHAGLFATASAVAELGQAWLDGAEAFGIAPELAKQATQQQAITDGNPRGLGFLLKSAEGSSSGDLFSDNSFGHTGFTGTSLWVDPKRQLVVALMTNRVYPGREKPGILAFRRALHDLLARGIDSK
ncbi:MAG: beta-lactamase family protein [Anaerolineaceae bacterium]|nr:beta-lactamase family protein [Anaerolineaceae bacterium]